MTITARTGTSKSARTPKGRIATALVGAAALILTGCATDDGQELHDMNVVTFLPLDSITFTPEMFAYAGGYFEKHGLNVNLEPVQGSAAAMQAVISGAADITRVSSLDSFPAFEQGQPISSIGTMAYGSPIWFLSHDANPIESAQDMAGQVVGLGSIGGTSENLLNLTLDANGVARDDVTRQAVPVTSATFELVRQGQLATYMVSIDTAFYIGNQNDDAVLSQAGLEETPDLHTWIASSALLEDAERAEEVRAFLAAIREAMQFVLDDAPNDFAEVISILEQSEFEIPALSVEEVAIESLSWYAENVWIDPDGDHGLIENDAEAWQIAYDTYVEGGLLEGGHDPQSWVTDEFVPTD
ncbi:nitrate ABC transporter substrate-binding protein [Pseudoclavibacter endophyticus]|uniref:ABC transporter substrate-binding protein n=1 Tax=Pseudoclavibacter endophyticus TaxID=1778590 RepID=A0A6H9WTB2_9MICO|nr:ABC transporter substrate-binding protein [Pseudoclavibacter endophyticus]KAB1649644.1 ABC transporter substrate-binding protein [Pseudoclavibacter endophyticus]GGA60977.1 nitrate ABC transporter substrate-binding protein [Pseudoclavibacter endophyticus]